MSNTPVDLIPASVAPDGTHAHTEEQLHFAEIPQAASHTVPSLLDLRIQKGLSPEAVASALRLSQAQIHALEAQNWSVLPGAAYIKGFLRNYTRLLNVAPEPYIAQYEASLGTASPGGTPHTSVAAKTTAYVSAAMPALPADPAALSTFTASGHEQKSQQSIAGIIGLLIAATLVFLLYWERALWLPKVVAVTESAVSWVTQPFASKPRAAPTAPAVAPSPAETTTPTMPIPAPVAPSAESSASAPVVAVAAIAEASSAASTATGVAAADAKPAPLIITKPAIGPMRALNLQMSKPVWLEVRDSGNNIIYYGTKPAGTKDTIKGAAPLMVVIGAADAMSLSVDGKPMDLTSIADGNVARLKIE